MQGADEPQKDWSINALGQPNFWVNWPRGRVTFEAFRHVKNRRATRGIAHACSIGVLRRVPPCDRTMSLGSVQFWLTQLNKSGHRNTTPTQNTKTLYLRAISGLDEWLPGRTFPSYRTVVSDGQVERQAITKSFKNVEDLMHYCNESDHGTKTAQRVAREFLASPRVAGASASVQTITRSAIKSYFKKHDIVLDIPNTGRKRDGRAPSETAMTLENLYKMLQNGRPSLAMRTIIMIKFQSGMDSATFADRFNHEGYSQIVRHFKTDDYSMWNLDACPVPIRVVRVKTDRPYTTFIDRDAVSQLREYLAWKAAKHGRHDASKPLFLTKFGNPIHSEWISKGFSAVAGRAGIQERVSGRVFKMRAHDVRDLLKSALLASGCAQYAADHVLGHAPRDSYEKQAILFPDDLRREYAMASSRINIFSKVESALNSPKDPETQEARIRELEAEVAELKQSKTQDGLVDDRHKNSMNKMHEEIKRLTRVLDSLPDDIKARMADKFEDSDGMD